MKFADLNEYVLTDILKYVPLIDRFVLERVCKDFKSIFDEIKWKQFALQFSQASRYELNNRCCICPSRDHFVSHESHVRMPPAKLTASVLVMLLTHHRNLTTIIFDIFSGYPNVEEYVNEIRKNCSKLEHLEIWISPNHIPAAGGLDLTGLNLSCLRVGLMLTEMGPYVVRFRRMYANLRLKDIFHEEAIISKFSGDIKSIIGSEEDLIMQLTATGDQLTHIDLTQALVITVTEKVLKQLSRTGMNIKYLKLHSKLNFKAIAENLKLNQVETLHIVSKTGGLLKSTYVNQLRRNCPKLKCLKLDQQWCAWQQVFVWKQKDRL